MIKYTIIYNRYSYCLNNPLKYVDPSGMLIDWVQRTVDGITEIYYDRDVKSQADVDAKYGKKSGVVHLQDGYTFNGYTFYNDHVNNLYGVVKNSNGNVINNDKNIVYGNDYTIFAGVTDNSLNAETLHKNWFLSYTGPNNPKIYGNSSLNIPIEESYLYIPRNKSEYGSYLHDLMYNEKFAKGPLDAIFNTKTLDADILLMLDSMSVAGDRNVPLKDRIRADLTATAFKGIVGFKLIKKSLGL